MPAIDFARAYHELGMDQAYDNFLTAASQQTADGYWHIPVLKEVSPNRVVKTLRRLGVDVYLYTEDLDKSITVNDRNPKDGSYWVRCKASVEADEKNKNLSADNLAQKGIRGLTVLERLLLELAYYLASDAHLDVTTVTLCSGSRDSGGYVPNVYWYSRSRGVCVDWCGPGNRNDNLRARAAVSVSLPQAA